MGYEGCKKTQEIKYNLIKCGKPGCILNGFVFFEPQAMQ